MNWIVELGKISWMGVGVAILASYVLGFSWYHWNLLGKPWATALGMTKEEADNLDGMGGVFAFSLVGGIIKAVFIALLMEGTGTNSISGGLLFGLLIGISFAATSVIYHDGFARRPRIMTYIDAAFDVIELALIGAIYGAFFL
ncbi:MAG: DUF1761 domain-containing protein [Oligoflexales bacterium]